MDSVSMDAGSPGIGSTGMDAPEAPEAPQAPEVNAPEAPQVSQVRDGFDGPAAPAAAQRADGDRFDGGAAAPAADRAPRIPGESDYSRQLPEGLPPDAYSPTRSGWHDYRQDSIVAPASMNVTADEMRDYMLRHAVPGQDPSRPVTNGQESTVVDPRGGFWGAVQGGRQLVQGQTDRVRTDISNDGLSISNSTLPGHALHDGRIVRTAYQDDQGNWRVRTHGYGNNEGLMPGVNAGLNQWQGPQIFRAVDEGMAANIRAHHAN